MAYRERNAELIGCLGTTGLPNFATDWAAIWTGKALFRTWTHQQWAAYVRQNDLASNWKSWSTYVGERYGYL